jgi:hypothetical protein
MNNNFLVSMKKMPLWALLFSCLFRCTNHSPTPLDETNVLNSPEFQEWCSISKVVRGEESTKPVSALWSPGMTKEEAIDMARKHSDYLGKQRIIVDMLLQKKITNEDFKLTSDSLLAASGLPQSVQSELRQALPGSSENEDIRNRYLSALRQLYAAYPELVPLGMPKLEELYGKCSSNQNSNQ